MGEWSNRVLLITGSSRGGIGAAAARLAHERGGTVILHGHTANDELLAFAQELGLKYITCDISDKAAVAKAVKKAADFYGRIDALINAAGLANSQPFLESEDTHWEQQFRVNVLGTVHVCQEVIPYMQKQGGGRIVNVASTRGHATLASNRITAYSAAKAAIINLTASLAKEFSPGIAVNCVSPSFTLTHMSQTWNDTVRAQAKTSLVGRAAEPAEIAEPILFLAHDRAGFITGQDLLVDGGYELAGK
jgi:NAD(P)-dependent dehydrogenase (short-subunit alcohol dehydrogenase family)